MEPTAKQLFDTALHLPDSERAELAARLIESLDNQIDDDLDAAWGAEIKRRLEEIDSGKVATIPWSEARRMIMGEQDDLLLCDSPRHGAGWCRIPRQGGRG